MKIYFAEIKKKFIQVIGFFFITFILCYIFSEQLYYVLLIPLQSLQQDIPKFIYTNIFEAFFTYTNTAFITTCLLSIPVIVLQIYRFLSPALLKQEKRKFFFYIIISFCLFLMSILIVYFYVIPIAWRFFLNFQNSQLSFMPKVSEYLSVNFSIFSGFILMFQAPVLLIFLCNFNILSIENIQKIRKMTYVLIFILAAFLTPPDVFSQLLLAIPLITIYEITILIIKLTKK